MAYETRTHGRLSDGVRVTACGPGIRRRRALWQWPLAYELVTLRATAYAALGFDCDPSRSGRAGGGELHGRGRSADTERLRDTHGERTRAQSSICLIVRFTVATMRGRSHSDTWAAWQPV